MHLVNSNTGHQLGFMVPDHPSQPDFLHSETQNEGAIITFEVQCAKTAWRSSQEGKLEIALTYTEEVWGQNHFIVRDPQGLLIDIVEHVQQ